MLTIFIGKLFKNYQSISYLKKTFSVPEYYDPTIIILEDVIYYIMLTILPFPLYNIPVMQV